MDLSAHAISPRRKSGHLFLFVLFHLQLKSLVLNPAFSPLFLSLFWDNVSLSHSFYSPFLLISFPGCFSFLEKLGNMGPINYGFWSSHVAFTWVMLFEESSLFMYLAVSLWGFSSAAFSEDGVFFFFLFLFSWEKWDLLIIELRGQNSLGNGYCSDVLKFAVLVVFLSENSHVLVPEKWILKNWKFLVFSPMNRL